MILILAETRNLDTAKSIQQELRKAFPELEPVIAQSEHPPTFDHEDWDDLLLVLFDDQVIPLKLEAFLKRYLDAHSRQTAVLPIALNRDRQKPPAPLSHLKSLVYNDAAQGTRGRLATRVGAILGLRPTRENKKIFISYRATDGRRTADAFYAYLNEHGFNAWKDEAPEGTNLREGEDVQSQIETRIVDGADLLLVIDTPDALESDWITKEIDLANANLIPVFPVVCRAEGDLSRGPRFFSLRSLDRYHTLSNWASDRPLIEEQLSSVLGELDSFISEMFQRRLKLPRLTRRAFEQKSFAWAEEDLKRALYSATREIPNHFLKRKFLLHCAYLLSVSPISLEALSALSRQYRFERDFYIYDGLPLPMSELRRIFEHARFDQGREPFPVHINELHGHLEMMGGL